MTFIQKGKTNWKYLVLVFALAVIVGGVVLIWGKYFRLLGETVRQTEKIEESREKDIKVPLEEVTKKPLLLIRSIERGDVWTEKGIYLADVDTGNLKQISQYPFQYFGLYGENLILKNTEEDKYFLYDFDEKHFLPLNFPDPPWRILSSIDSGKKLLLHQNERDYIFSFLENNYTEAIFREKAKEILTNDKIGEYSILGYDSLSQKIFFQQHDEGIGCSSIAIVDLATKDIQQIEDKNFSDGTSIGCFYLSPSMKKAVNIEMRTDGKTLVHLYNVGNISDPVHSVDITELVDNFRDIYSLDWLSDELRVVAGFHNSLALIDFPKSAIKKIYQDATLGQSYLYWDRNNVVVSSDNKWGSFVDYYSAKYDDRGRPSMDSKNDRYRVVAVDIDTSNSKVILDGSDFLQVIGWFNF